MECCVQIFLDDHWGTAAIFEPDPHTLDNGIAGGGRLQYDIDYAVAHLGNRAAEISPGLVVGFDRVSPPGHYRTRCTGSTVKSWGTI
jgi:hypothetical protein